MIKDFWIDPDEESPEAAIWFRVQMAIASRDGDVYPESRLVAWLAESHLEHVASHALREAPDAFLLVARKG